MLQWFGKAGVPSPLACGLKFDDFLWMHALDMPAPKFYRIYKLTNVSVYLGLFKFSLIPNIVPHFLQVRNIALKTAVDADKAILAANEWLRRPEPTPPTSWLTCDRYVLARKRRGASEQWASCPCCFLLYYRTLPTFSAPVLFLFVLIQLFYVSIQKTNLYVAFSH